MAPSVVALFVCKASRAPLVPMERVEAIAETGLRGDRHAKPGSHRQVLLIGQEILDQLGLAPGQVREQVTVRGIDLDRLALGARLRIGSALLEIANPCQPCERMDEIRAGLKDTLVGRRGRFVRVVESGSFAVGDPLVVDGA
jgi:MOSC domain-containing protein YiiM